MKTVGTPWNLMHFSMNNLKEKGCNASNIYDGCEKALSSVMRKLQSPLQGIVFLKKESWNFRIKN